MGRIVEMDIWDNDFLDLVEEAHLTFGGNSDSEIALAALKGFLDVCYGTRDGSACAELSWDGHYKIDPSSSAPRVALPVNSISTTVTTPASSANAPDFLNSLLMRQLR